MFVGRAGGRAVFVEGCAVFVGRAGGRAVFVGWAGGFVELAVGHLGETLCDVKFREYRKCGKCGRGLALRKPHDNVLRMLRALCGFGRHQLPNMEGNREIHRDVSNRVYVCRPVA